jgi:hypothetical protein
LAREIAGTRPVDDHQPEILAVLTSRQGKEMNTSLTRLEADADRSLIDFLKIDLKLGLTFLDLAEQHHAEEDRAKSLENARRAVDTVRHFQARIIDHPEWAEIDAEAHRLESLISTRESMHPTRPQ